MNVNKLLYIRQCPVCEQGLARPRICRPPSPRTASEKASNNAVSRQIEPNSVAFVICDECDAVWTDPTFMERITTKVDSDPACPQCQEPLWGPQSHWATLEEIYLLGWYNYIQIASLQTESDD
ncbi:hypothetical protein SH501x_005271 [Pirellulaceae bacterium SH501]